MPDPSGRIILARVVKAYAKRSPNELSLLVGDEITVFDATNATMWFGQLLPRSDKKNESVATAHAATMDLPTGWFPAQNCVPVGAPPLPNHPSNTTSKGGVRLSMRIDTSTFRNQITAALGDPGTVVGTSIPGIPSPRLRKHARVLHEYAAESPSELSISVGDIISLLSCQEEESWWEGELASGLIGYFPKDFVQVFRDPTAKTDKPVVANSTKALEYSEFEDPHAIAIIAQVITAHEPVVATNDHGTPFLSLPAGAVIALLDSNPNHMYWLAVHFNNNTASLQHSPTAARHSPPKSAPTLARVGLVPKANLAVFEGLTEPQCNYPFTPIPLGLTRILANRAVGSVSAVDGSEACLARVAFEFVGENENEHEYLGVGDLVWIIDDDEVVRSEAWVEVEIDTKRGFCPTSFLEILSDRVAAPKPDMVVDYDLQSPSTTSSNTTKDATTVQPQKSNVEPPSSSSHPDDSLTASHEPASAASAPSAEATASPTITTTKKKKRRAEGKDKESRSRDKESKEPKETTNKEGEMTPRGPFSTSSAILARALYAYSAESNSELTLNVGDIVRLIDYPANEEWWEGILLSPEGTSLPDEYSGFFPRDFVVTLAKDPSGEKKKKRPKRGAASGKTRTKKSAHSASSAAAAQSSTDGTKGDEITSHRSNSKRARASTTTTLSPSAGLRSSRDASAEPSVDVRAYVNEIDDLKTQIESLKMDLDIRQAELDTASAEVGMLQNELETNRLESELNGSEVDALKAELTAVRLSYESTLEQEKAASAAKSNDESEELQAENQSLKAEVAKWRARAEASEAQQAKLNAQVSQLSKKLEESHQQAVERAKHHRQQTQQQAATMPKRAPPPAAAVHAVETPIKAEPSSEPVSMPAPSSVPETPVVELKASEATPSTPEKVTPPPTTTTTVQKGPPSAAPPSTPTASASTPPNAALPATPKSRALPPTPGTGMVKTGSSPKLAVATNSAPAKRTLPPAQPAPKLPADFVKKTAAPTAAYKAASHISAQTAAASAKRAAVSTPSRPSQSNLTAQPKSPVTPTSKNTANVVATAPKSTTSSHATPKVADEFENKRKFFESLK